MKKTGTTPPTVRPIWKYPTATTPLADIAPLGEHFGVRIDPKEGLVLYDPKNIPAIEKKIVVGAYEIQKRIAAAKNAGKCIAIIPGSFDLVHAGHLFYIEQIINCQVKEAGCVPSDVFVATLIDSDALIREVKKNKLRTEPFPRPIEPEGERARSLSALTNVDMVGIVPAPSDIALQSSPPAHDPDTLLAEIASLPFNAVDRIELAQAIHAYQALLEITAHDLPLSAWRWKIQAWQLCMLSIINDWNTRMSSPIPFGPGTAVRWISIGDHEYKDQVAFVARHAGMIPAFIEDIKILSTSALLKLYIEKYGSNARDAIRTYKKEAQKIAFP